jgi:hypothetical protein
MMNLIRQSRPTAPTRASSPAPHDHFSSPVLARALACTGDAATALDEWLQHHAPRLNEVQYVTCAVALTQLESARDALAGVSTAVAHQ